MAVYQNLTLTQLSQDPDRNCSVIRILWTSTQTGASYNMVDNTGYLTVRVNGQENIEPVNYILPRQTEQSIVDRELVVFHDTKGEALVEVETWMDTQISAGEVTLYETLQLDRIPRASQLRATDCVIGQSSRLVVSRKNSAYSHAIAWSFGQRTGFLNAQGAMVDQQEIFREEGLDFLIPDSFYDEIPNAPSGSCTLTVTTYDGQQQIGQPYSAEFTVSADEALCRPVVLGGVADICPATLALTGDDRILVRNQSVARCQVTATAKLGASIVQRTIQDQQVDSELVLSPVNSMQILFGAVDSRGFSQTYRLPVDIIPYVSVSCEAVAERLGTVTGQARLTVTGNYYPGSFGACDNALSLSYSINGADPVPMEYTLTDANRYEAVAQLTDMAYDRLYTLTVQASDLLTGVTKRTVLKKGVPVFDWGENDFSFRVPVHMDRPLGVECGGTGSNLPEEIWSNLELSPAMEPGEEYLTCQRWNGLPVYTSLIQWGQMPNSCCIGRLHHCRASRILSCQGSTSDGRALPYGAQGSRIEIYADPLQIYVDAQGDESASTVMAQLYYIK